MPDRLAILSYRAAITAPIATILYVINFVSGFPPGIFCHAVACLSPIAVILGICALLARLLIRSKSTAPNRALAGIVVGGASGWAYMTFLPLPLLFLRASYTGATVSCMSNLIQADFALKSYSQDYVEWFPSVLGGVMRWLHLYATTTSCYALGRKIVFFHHMLFVAHFPRVV